MGLSGKAGGGFFALPLLVADVEYRAWTQDRKLRHPSFKGVHELEGPTEAYEKIEGPKP
ncbi:hypothetical protein [Ensifer adhaerens]|uniref:ATP dependent DNA ligase n=1 Tax=Ensifer adhaerens TaxID=106592 RepID=UPI000AB2B2DA